MIKVSIIEDKNDLRSSLGKLINESVGFKCISTYANCESAMPAVYKDKPDVILMDIELEGGMSGIDGLRIIKEKMPCFNIIMLTIYEDNELVFNALKYGATGYLVKNTDFGEILVAIKEAHEGGSPMSMTIARKVVDSFKIKPLAFPLTCRESEILDLLCNGSSYQSIANKLFIEKTTVKFHIRNIYSKLQVSNRTEAILKVKTKKLADL